MVFYPDEHIADTSPLTKQHSISVFFPAYNDEASIEKLVLHALAVLPDMTEDYEVIVINDGSTDNTRRVLDRLARRFAPYVRVIHHLRNSGYGASLRTGFRSARKDLIFYTDGDGQYDAREITKLRPLMTPDVDVVNGYKLRRADSLKRRLAGGVYNRIARLLFDLPIRDVDCDFRLIRRARLNRLPLISSSGAICVELVRRLAADGCKFAEIGVNHHPRRHGQSQFFTFRRIAQTLIDFSSLWWKLVAKKMFQVSSFKIFLASMFK